MIYARLIHHLSSIANNVRRNFLDGYRFVQVTTRLGYSPFPVLGRGISLGYTCGPLSVRTSLGAWWRGVPTSGARAYSLASVFSNYRYFRRKGKLVRSWNVRSVQVLQVRLGRYMDSKAER